jgi:hypothetical protein
MKLMDELEKVRCEKKELQKLVKRMPEKNKKTNTRQHQTSGMSISEPQVPGETLQDYTKRLYQEERERNEVMQT